jgi:type IV secretory pathway TraG/TraD family ATPase VirD4
LVEYNPILYITNHDVTMLGCLFAKEADFQFQKREHSFVYAVVLLLLVSIYCKGGSTRGRTRDKHQQHCVSSRHTSCVIKQK